MRTHPAEASRSEENKNVRMSLHVLQPAATDKENLVGPGRSTIFAEKNKKIENEKKINVVSVKNTVKKKKGSQPSAGESSKKSVTANDLTSEEPSETYWKQLAERRQVALEEALAENEALNEKIETLQQENALAQEMLNEARSIIEVLNEIIDGNEDQSGVDTSVDDN